MTATISPVIGEATVQELREAMRGEVIAARDEGYEEAAKVWNGAHDGRRPALIARCAGAADVAAAIGFARSNQLKLAIRGGAHSIAGFSTCDGGLVIDLSPMAGVRVDPAGDGRMSAAARPGPASITRRRPTGLRPRAASYRRPASAATRSAAGSAG